MNPKPAAAPAEPLRPSRGRRIALGALLFASTAGLAVAAWALPFVEVRTAKATHAILGAEQTGNLSLVLVATGALGALLAVTYAAGRSARRAAFFVVGGVGLLFSGILLGHVRQTVAQGAVRDPAIWERVRHVPVELAIGGGLWLCLGASVLTVLLAIVVFHLGRVPPPAPSPKRRPGFR